MGFGGGFSSSGLVFKATSQAIVPASQFRQIVWIESTRAVACATWKTCSSLAGKAAHVRHRQQLPAAARPRAGRQTVAWGQTLTLASVRAAHELRIVPRVEVVGKNEEKY